MTSSWPGFGSRRPPDPAAQAALDAAVAAFLDLDTRQRYVTDALAALRATSAPPFAQPSWVGGWTQVAERCSAAIDEYLSATTQWALTDSFGRATTVDPRAAERAFHGAHTKLAECAGEVDAFYRKHSQELEQAKVRLAAAPRLAGQARQAAAQAERQLTRAEADGIAYDSVMEVAGTLVTALAALNMAEQTGQIGDLHTATEAVLAAAGEVEEAIVTARGLEQSVRSSVASVRTRAAAVANRLENLPQTRSALLREFSAASTKDLAGADERAAKALADAHDDLAEVDRALAAGEIEPAAKALAATREDLTTAEKWHKDLTDRLHLLRQTRDDPQGAMSKARFRLRDAQQLAINLGVTDRWASVLDHQAARLDQAVDGLVGPHPDYWAYLTELRQVEDFIREVVDRIRDSVAR